MNHGGLPPVGESDASQGSSLTVFGIATTVLRERRLILVVLTVTVGMALAFVLLKPRSYTTLFSFVPQASGDPARASLAGLAGQFGLSLGSGSSQLQSPQMYADLLSTHAVLAPIAADSFVVDSDEAVRVTLFTVLKLDAERSERRLVRAIRALREDIVRTSVATRTTGVVTVRVRTESAVLSRAIAERLLESLNHFNFVTRQSQASEERRFVESRVASARAALREGENALERFLRTNRQIQNSPELTLQRARLERELELQQQIVTGLSQQFEEARIREVRDVPVITLLEPPIVAALPDPRGGSVILLGAIGIGLLIGIGWALLREEFRRTRDEMPEYAALRAEWRRVRGSGG